MIVTKVKTLSKQHKVMRRSALLPAKQHHQESVCSIDDIRVRAFHMYQKRGGQARR